jgi:hypothetical protein
LELYRSPVVASQLDPLRRFALDRLANLFRGRGIALNRFLEDPHRDAVKPSRASPQTELLSPVFGKR